MKAAMEKKHYCLGLFIVLVFIAVITTTSAQELKHGTIDREALVKRHNLKISNIKEPGPTQVGNGDFAYGFDITGMQTFNDKFTTMSHWGWHSVKPPNGLKPEDFKQTLVNTHGRMVGYPLRDPKQDELVKWLSANPHRFNLGRIGLWLKRADGSEAKISDLKDAVQYLDLWAGIAESNFTLDGEPVKVITIADPNRDIVSFRIQSPLLRKGRLGVFVNFPYASLGFFGNGSDYNSPSSHQTNLKMTGSQSAIFNRKLDSTSYSVVCKWTGATKIGKVKNHFYNFLPGNGQDAVEYTFSFSRQKSNINLPSFTIVKNNSSMHWPAFWKSGGAIDLSQSKDPRWFELERRVVLSQYLMALNAAGNYPPQETGLVNNSWYGRFHYEMYWWHTAHYALWDRWPLLNKSLHLYQDKLKSSEKRAADQGYIGARWPKCTGPDGREWPDITHAFLIWQQPHPIFFADLDYRAHPTLATLKKWDEVIEQTADFLASYAYLDSTRNQYVLGPPIRVVSENNQAESTQNPAFELEYWRYALQTAQQWRRKLNKPAKAKWNDVLNKLSPIPQKDGLYEQWENMDNMWTKYNFEHPALAGVYGMLPGYSIDTTVMEHTFQKMQAVWKYNTGWGWDFPMVAMTAARLGHQADAVDMLLHQSPKNGFDDHGLVGGGNPYPYFPTNGGLLYAVAMMTAGWDGDANKPQPGWPKDGSWVVRWEGLKKAP